MWQEEVRNNYHDETYYLFNQALDTYMGRLQKIYNRGMIEAWIEEGNLKGRSPWSIKETLQYFEGLPYPENEGERKIWIAGLNSTKAKNKRPSLTPLPEIFEPSVQKEVKREYAIVG